MPALVWFRTDLRLRDNPALHAAIEHDGIVVPVFIHAPDEEAPWQPGAASNWWLHQSLVSLQLSLQCLGSHLIIRRGPTFKALCALAKETRATAIFWNRRYEPAIIARDEKLEDTLRGEGFKVQSFNAALLHDPWTIQNQSGNPFQVFTPFWKSCLMDLEPATTFSAPKHLPQPAKWPKSLRVDELGLLPKINWAQGIAAAWHPGEESAQKRLKEFLSSAFEDYSRHRNMPGTIGTSRLSPYLHFGEISPGQIWHAVRHYANSRKIQTWRTSQFITEIGWREFAYYLLNHFPHTPEVPLHRNFEKLPWRKNAAKLKSWQKGQTGYPIVDAGMRELWATGWMHNRVRMIVASFLVKDLLISWQEGARWFWDTLVDADLANNTLGWQWTTGCGADAAPYFRIFNPITQGERFDRDGEFVRRWCPELAKLPDKWIHKPANAPSEVLRMAGVKLGRTYSKMIVNHAFARDRAIESFKRVKS